MLTALAEEVIRAIQDDKIQGYKDYWSSIAPKDDREYFMRWIFAFLSVHTTWSANVFAFNTLNADELWWNNSALLLEKLHSSKVGLYNRRLKGIEAFSKSFWEDPIAWKKLNEETWTECRDRLAAKCHGIGLAKTAFALELCYPLSNESVCLDTHMLQLYGYSTEKEKAKGAKYNSYTEMERHWVEHCKAKNIPAYIGRALFWDTRQQKDDSRYWSYVFENKKNAT